MSFKPWDDSKDPQDITDWDLDWIDRLVDSETLIAVDWTIAKAPNADAGNPLVIAAEINDPGGLSKVWLSGGVKGVYHLTCHATTSVGRQYDHTMGLKVESL